MPRTFITEKTIPVILRELDIWSGKLTWPDFAQRVAGVLGENSISRHALLKYPQIVDAFNQRKKNLKESFEKAPEKNVTLDFALEEISRLEAENERLKRQVALFQEQFVRWQQNLMMMPGVDMERLNLQLDKPLPKVNRR